MSSREVERLYEELRRSEENLRAVVEHSPDAICVAGEDDAILYVNSRLVALLGYSSPAELLGRPATTTLVHPDDLGLVADGQQRQLAGEAAETLELRCLRRDGTPVFIEGSSTAIHFNGKPASLTTARDITAKRRLEEQLRHAQKMEAVGKLAGGVAHDFNNLLAVIIGGVALASEDLADAPPTVHEILASITAAAERAAALTQQLLTVSRTKPHRAVVLDLNSVVRGLGPVLERLAGKKVSLRTELATPLGTIEADEQHMQQLLLNLVVNARDAMPSGGSVKIETANVALDVAGAASSGLKPGAYVSLVVTDTGHGMDAATRARIFEPFFTTKSIGEGTGLGLSVVFGIVKERGGSITVESEPGRGATFRILLPQTGALVLGAAGGAGASAPRAKHEDAPRRVLLVEDEEPVRKVVQRLLTRFGYTVIVADGPLAALALLDEQRGIDLVLTDLAMPGMDGRAMAKLAAERHPGLRFLFMSGYAEHAAVKGGPAAPHEHLLAKPFTPDALKVAVVAALERAPQSH